MASSLVAGRKVVTTAGTPVRLTAAAVRSNKVIITPLPDNTKPVVIGNSAVVGPVANRAGIVLTPTSHPLCLEMDDLNLIYLDAEVNGEGVSYAYFV